MTEEDNGPRCVFCGAPWTAAMLRLYDAGTNGAVCSCCVIFPDFEGFEPEPEPEPAPRPHVPLPPELSCQACGRVLYRLFSPEVEDESAPDR
jgi:hypothetical protein